MYQAEQQEEQAKVEKLRDAGADPHDVKYAVRPPPLAAAAASTACAAPPLLRDTGITCCRRTSWLSPLQ